MHAATPQWCQSRQSIANQVSLLLSSPTVHGKTHDVVRQMVHHVSVWDLTIFCFLFSELSEEIRPSGLLTLLIIVSRNLVLGNLGWYSAIIIIRGLG